MRKFTCFVLTLVAASMISAQAVAQTAFVDQATGMVRIEGTGYVGISFNSNDNDLIAANGIANIGNGSTTFDVALAPGNLSWLDFGGYPNPVELGAIVPAMRPSGDGLFVEFVLSNFQTIPGELVFVPIPEPTTMMMAGMGALGLCFRRRRNG